MQKQNVNKVSALNVAAACSIAGMTHPVDAVDSERDLEVVRCLRLDLNDRLGGAATVPAVIDNLVGDLRGRQRRGSQQKPRCQRAESKQTRFARARPQSGCERGGGEKETRGRIEKLCVHFPP